MVKIEGAQENKSLAKDKYGLFDPSKLKDYPGGIETYIDDGVIKSGTYTGYNRIAVSVSEMMSTQDYFFATKDYKSFILAERLKEILNSEYNILDKSKISGFGDIPTDFPDEIDLGNFVLHRSEIYRYADSYNEEDIMMEYPDLKFFTLSQKPVTAADEIAYFKGPAQIEAVDNSGLKYAYDLIAKESVDSKGQYSLGKFYINSNFTENNSSLYKTYGGISGCGGPKIDIVQNISDNDLVKITQTAGGVVLYTLKDKNHKINQAAYSMKTFNDSNSLIYEEYVAKNPVLIFKDPFNRYVELVETDYAVEPGCGKPVIYLYPEKDTKVTLKFVEPINVTTSIPTYANQWNVLANPDGQLTDLQPNLTDCNKIDYKKPGSEYAKTACETNSYPYIYWAGQASGAYPEQNRGWIVESINIENFLGEKLSEMGLNQKEKKDMIDYWVPVLLSKETSYFKISFVQTQQMNAFIPMQVTPAPNSVLRIFLDWKPLSQKPVQEMTPQKLFHFNREGFSLVEWGGLKFH
jgi:hypothetical protein